jgi:hypothetical protein
MDPRIPPSGPFSPIALLSLSAPQAFADGVADSIDFDTVTYEKGDIGRIVTPNVSGIIFAVGPGLYLIQVQIVTSVAVAIELSTELLTGSTATPSANKNAATDRIQNTNNSAVRKSDTPFSADIFAGLIVGFKGTGAAGNITTAQALIQRLGSP